MLTTMITLITWTASGNYLMAFIGYSLYPAIALSKKEEPTQNQIYRRVLFSTTFLLAGISLTMLARTLGHS